MEGLTYVSTGQFAEICHVNKKTLFHYDEIGLFKPTYVDDKGYRYYSLNQLDTFLMITALKDLGISLKEIKTYLEERTPDHILQMSNDMIHKVDKEMDKLKNIRNILQETIEYTHRGLQAWKNEVRLIDQEEEYLMLSPLIQESDVLTDLRWLTFFRQFERRTQSANTSFVGAMVSKDHIQAGKWNDKSYLFAKTQVPELATMIKPKETYAVTFHHGSYENIGNAYAELLTYLQQQGLSLEAFAYEEYLVDEVAVQKEEDYITQITVRVSSN
ncbi:MerR family transcriptional regulator [Paenibacillus sp. MER 99-2]|uniref:MerR family transcriptional regulator n=1 Tax=Paenibacillus sp. MER 99-2 TaxID=2939572 RepID=UPI00203B1935|nr:MerR family transcriptional regulator [Paenibacillus sp. MER 99-2]MCM3171892.1 MerR family transcriptional regulator [Paenibacillus sp. MER 99-2]